jgi:hypothetical protein
MHLCRLNGTSETNRVVCVSKGDTRVRLDEYRARRDIGKHRRKKVAARIFVNVQK